MSNSSKFCISALNGKLSNFCGGQMKVIKINLLVCLGIIIFISGCSMSPKITATPSQGTVPLKVEFSAEKSKQGTSKIALYQWDFNSDGVIDAEGITATNTYEKVGDYDAKLILTDEKGKTASKTATINVTSRLITVVITSPVPNEDIGKSDVMVTGTVINPGGNKERITVNDSPGLIHNGQFIVNKVHLTEGENTISVNVIDDDGSTGTASVTVQGKAQKIVSISCDDITGVSPMETTFSVSVSGDYTPTVTCDKKPESGDCEWLSTPTNYKARLTGEGVYTFSAKVTDNLNNEYSDSISIAVQNSQAIDSTLRSEWDNMKTGLASGDIEKALKDFTLSSSTKEYGPIFTELKDQLPAIANRMAEIEPVYIKGSTAKYRIRRDQVIDGQIQTVTYYIYFVMDPYGNWWIDSF
jgi:hypothetical protein